MTCPYCKGLGWRWVGEWEGDAHREECDPCEGRGHGRLTLWAMAIPWLLCGVLWGLVLGGLSWLLTHGWDALGVVAASLTP